MNQRVAGNLVVRLCSSHGRTCLYYIYIVCIYMYRFVADLRSSLFSIYFRRSVPLPAYARTFIDQPKRMPIRDNMYTYISI